MLSLRVLIYILVFIFWAHLFQPTAHILKNITIMNMEMMWLDVILALLFFWAIANLRVLYHCITKNDLKQRTVLIFMLWGILPLVNGWLSGNNNMFFFMRLFAWGLLAIIGPLAFSSLEQVYYFVKFYLLLHTIRVLYYFIFLVVIPNAWWQKIEGFGWDEFVCTFLIIGFLPFEKKTLYEKWLVYVILPISIILIIVFNGRTLYIGSILAMVIFMALGYKVEGIRLRKVVLYIGILLPLLFSTVAYDLIDSISERFNTVLHYKEEGSASYRLIAWDILLDKIKQKPLLGYGAGADIGIYMILPDTHKWGGRTPHNVYLETAAWGGVSTLLFFLLIQAMVIIKGIKTICTAHPNIGALLVASIAGMIGIIWSAIFAPVVHLTYFQIWLYPTFILILTKIANMEIDKRILNA